MQVMNYAEFIDSLGLIALQSFDDKTKYPTTPDKMKALFEFMGFKVT